MHVEIELGNENKRIFLLIDGEERMWVDTSGLPNSAFLCAMFDGVEVMTATVGEKNPSSRQFLSMDWCVNEWGGDKQLVEALKKRRQMTLDEMPRIREKYPEIFGLNGTD